MGDCAGGGGRVGGVVRDFEEPAVGARGEGVEERLVRGVADQGQ